MHVSSQIHYILVQNRQGKTRLAKWFDPYDDVEKRKLQSEIHKIVASRESKFTNFLEVRLSILPRDICGIYAQKTHLVEQFRTHKVVYRRYAGLFFCVCVDPTDNELSYLEAIHLFVEVLDAYFGNVCELDLVFNFYKVWSSIPYVHCQRCCCCAKCSPMLNLLCQVFSILDEVFLAGEVMETSKNIILSRVEQIDNLA